MTKTYTYKYKLIPDNWKPEPVPSSDDIYTTLIYRNKASIYLSDWLYVMHTWRRYIIKFMLYPLILLTLAWGFHWVIFSVLIIVVSLLDLYIKVRIKMFHEAVAMIENVIDEVINQELSIKLPPILEYE